MEDPCFGCYAFEHCQWKEIYFHLCPCKSCIIKNICDDGCDDYERIFDMYHETIDRDY